MIKRKKPVSVAADRKIKYKQRKEKLNQWAHSDAKSNVGEYRT